MAEANDLKLFVKSQARAELAASLGNGFSDTDLVVFRDVLASMNARPHETVLRLAPSKAIVKELMLPQAACNYVTAILRNRIDRLAPWPLSEAVYGHRTLEPVDSSGQIRVRVAIAGRRTLDSLIVRLGQANIVPGRTDVAEDPNSADSIELLTSNFGLEQRILAILKTSLTGLLLVLGATTAINLQWSYSVLRDLNATEIRISELQEKLVDRVGEQRERARVTGMQEIINKKATEQPFSAILAALSAALPDHSWLTELSYRSPELFVSGRSILVPHVVEALDSVPMFTDVNFAAPTLRGRNGGAETFSIVLTVLHIRKGPPWE